MSAILLRIVRVVSVCLLLGIVIGSSSIYGPTDKEELKRLLSEVAGIYKDPVKAKPLKNAVLVTACNFGFVNHLHNFRCFAERLEMKFLVVAMDRLAYQYIKHNTTMNVVYMGGTGAHEVTGLSQEFRSKQFNVITTRKKEAVHEIMSLGYDVLFSDTDVAMIRDPIPYMVRINVDYAHSLNYFCRA